MQIWAANACLSLSALAASKAFDLAMIGLEQGDGVEVRVAGHNTPPHWLSFRCRGRLRGMVVGRGVTAPTASLGSRG
jgi:hypothetical protein